MIRADDTIGWSYIVACFCRYIAAHARRAEAGQVVDPQGVSIVERDVAGGGKHSLGVSSPHTHTPPPTSLFFYTIDKAIGIFIFRKQTQNSNVQLCFYTTNKSENGLTENILALSKGCY